MEEVFEKLNRIEYYCLLAAKNVLTLDDAAVLTGLSKSHLYKLTCSHNVPHYKPGGKMIYFDRVELENWLKQNRVASDDELEKTAVTYLVTGKKGGAL